MALYSGNMARLLLLAVFGVLVIGLSARGIRVRRGFNSSGYGTGSYGRGGGSGSDENASVSQEGNGCSSNNDNNRGYGNSGSREQAYNKNGRSSEHIRGGRSYAITAASAGAYNLNQ